MLFWPIHLEKLARNSNENIWNTPFCFDWLTISCPDKNSLLVDCNHDHLVMHSWAPKMHICSTQYVLLYWQMIEVIFQTPSVVCTNNCPSPRTVWFPCTGNPIRSISLKKMAAFWLDVTMERDWNPSNKWNLRLVVSRWKEDGIFKDEIRI